MGFKLCLLIASVIGAVSTQSFRVCVPESTPSATCQSMSKDDSQVQCLRVESRVDCALKLASSEADIGFFNEEETLLLAQEQPEHHRVIATVRDSTRLDPYSFEAVAIVPATHTNGLEGLRGGVYCHPGLGHPEVRWSPRVLKTLEEQAARTDRCPDVETAGKTAEEVEVETLNSFFSAACRPGAWSANATVDANLKSRFPNLCSLCGENSNCNEYTIDMGVLIAGIRNDNRHIQSLQCLNINSRAANRSAVAYVAWQHVREYFTIRNTEDVNSFHVLCPNGTTIPLSVENLASTVSPCSFVSQPWGTIIANPTHAPTLLSALQQWWPNGMNPGQNTWQSIMFNAVAGGVNARIVFENSPVFPVNYTRAIRQISPIESTSSCLPARRWCVISEPELLKCNWVRSASYVLGVQPPISCQLRRNILECLADIRDNNSDFIAAGSNYGYLARSLYQLGPVKLVQNSQQDAARIAAFVNEAAASSENITRFENLRGKRACFPEFGGLAYMAFVRAGRERGVLPNSECDYARVVGEFFEGACAPGAIDASHSISNSTTFNASVLCSACRPNTDVAANVSADQPICTWDQSNLFFGNNGSLACLNNPNNDVAFLNTRNITRYLQSMNLNPNQFRALCRDNTLASQPGTNVDDNCLLAFVVDAEVLTRRSDPQFNSLNVLLDWIELYFGYNAASGSQLINFEIFSQFRGISNLLFKDSTIDLTEPSITSTHAPARNYMELFQHLDACTGAAPGVASKSIYSVLTIFIMGFITRFVIA
ncbi:unnamed protein product [Arctia plantaginis]|uniref:Transferrin-like domain-containing protein n=1 Tax=Arctia plantaginis TaxID=874455 RepID=A0A8S0YSW0_ARCPL|nr:unnamed protein product [Arctia plantaginis]